jgi:hypothetical protein
VNYHNQNILFKLSINELSLKIEIIDNYNSIKNLSIDNAYIIDIKIIKKK